MIRSRWPYVFCTWRRQVQTNAIRLVQIAARPATTWPTVNRPGVVAMAKLSIA